MAITPRRGGRGVSVLVLNQANLRRMFVPGGLTFRYMNEVAREVSIEAKVIVDAENKGYGRFPGQLAASIGHSTTPAGPMMLRSNVRAEAPHALMYHNGTDPHHIRPGTPLVKNADGGKEGGLVFFWRKKGRVVRLPHVNHPGWKGNPFLTRAVDTVLRKKRIKRL